MSRLSPPEDFAKELYDEYCLAVGGKAFNGDPLPSWEDFRKDPNKKLQSDGWIRVALKAWESFNTA